MYPRVLSRPLVGPTLHPDVAGYAARCELAGAPLEDPDLAAIDQFVRGMAAANLWPRVDGLYHLGATLPAQTINVLDIGAGVSISDNRFVTHIPRIGFRFAAGSAFITYDGFVPADLPNWQLESATVGYYQRGDANPDSFAQITVGASEKVASIYTNFDGEAYFRLNCQTESRVATAGNAGLWLMSRTGPLGVDQFQSRNGVEFVAPGAIAAQGVPELEVRQYSTAATFSLMIAGGGFTLAEHAIIAGLVRTLGESFGWWLNDTAKTYFEYCESRGAPLTLGDQFAVNRFLTKMDNAGYLARIAKIVHLGAGENAQAVCLKTFQAMNLGPDVQLVRRRGMYFAADSYATLSGFAGAPYTRDRATMGYFQLNETPGYNSYFLSAGSGESFIYQNQDDGNAYYAMNGLFGLTVRPPAPTQGMILCSLAGQVETVSRDGDLVATHFGPTTVDPSPNFAMKGDGHVYSLLLLGDGFTIEEHADISDMVYELGEGIGWWPPTLPNHPDAQAYFDFCAERGAPLALPDQVAVNRFVRRMDDAGLWQRVDLCTIVGLANTGQGYTDVKSFQRWTPSSTVQFTPYRGHSATAGHYIVTNNWNPRIADHYKQDSATLAIYCCNSAPPEVSADITCAGGGFFSYIYCRYTDNVVYFAQNQGGDATATNTVGQQGFWLGSRTGPTQHDGYHEGVKIASETRPSSGLSEGNLTIMGSGQQIAFALAMGGVSEAEQGEIFDCVRELGTALGWYTPIQPLAAQQPEIPATPTKPQGATPR